MDHRFHGRAVRALLAAGVAATLAAGLAGCGSGQSDKTVVLATHDSFLLPRKVLADFTRKTGYKLEVQKQGDAGELTNKLVLTKSSPVADVVYGIDNTFASRAHDSGVLARYTPAHLPASIGRYTLPKSSGGSQLTPVDYGDVCVNVDDQWFARHHKAEPRTLDDLTRPAYRNLMVTPGATTSSPGLAFLLATISAKGPHWQQYWKALLANGLKVDSGWSQAWNEDYTAGGGHGSRPIVLSYASSIPDTIPKGSTKPTTSALLDTCFRQVEYAGVLAGAQNPAGAKAFVRFMLSHEVQAAMPDNMYVYPVDSRVRLPADWEKWAKVAPHPWPMSPEKITADRTRWLQQWRNLVTG
ncbi:MAG: thiamine ABC transporter substrate-binding protein [Marmoricola sp.]